MFYNIPAREVVQCDPCVVVSAKICTGSVILGGACAGAGIVDPAICALALTTGGSVCVASATVCTYFCKQQKFEG